MLSADGAIGVLDSGVGGVSVLSALRWRLPFENYIYLGDSENSPYGRKSSEEVRRIVKCNAERLVHMGCKALVIACNTATAVAVREIRSVFSQIPIVGLEPAVRPALAYAVKNGGDVLVLATDVTVCAERFIGLCERCCTELGGEFVGDGKSLVDTVNHRKKHSSCPRIYAVSLQDTVDYVEKGEVNSEAHIEYLKKRLLPYSGVSFSAVVLGCTHFPFAEKSISQALGYRTNFYDGADGASGYLERLLYEKGIARVSAGDEVGWVSWVDTLGGSGYAERFRRLRTSRS